MPLTFHTLDVFTDCRFGGNPLAVVHDADGLDSKRMQAIARELNLSETVFVLKPENPAHSAQACASSRPAASCPSPATRPSAPQSCCPSCARPSSTASATPSSRSSRRSAPVRVGVRLRARPGAVRRVRCAEAAGDGRRRSPRATSSPTPSACCRARSDSRTTRRCASAPATPSPSSPSSVSRRSPGRASMARCGPRRFPASEVDGVYLYTRQCVRKGSAFHARMFAPQLGVPEDPATGSAAVGFAGVVHDFDELPDGAAQAASSSRATRWAGRAASC